VLLRYLSVIQGSLDEMVRVWDLRTGHLLEQFQGHANSVYSVAFSPDGLSIVSGSLDRTLRIWDLSPATLAVLAVPPVPGEVPPTVVTTTSRHVFSGHSDFVLSVGYPGLIGSLGRVDQHGRPSPEPAFDIEWVISGSKDRQVLFWDAKKDVTDPSCLLTLQGHKNSGYL
jgi:general transcriptional corepressor TUP1